MLSSAMWSSVVSRTLAIAAIFVVSIAIGLVLVQLAAIDVGYAFDPDRCAAGVDDLAARAAGAAELLG
mgnify:CR=1 FL=1